VGSYWKYARRVWLAFNYSAGKNIHSENLKGDDEGQKDELSQEEPRNQ
jgi:hypothetical protein